MAVDKKSNITVTWNHINKRGLAEKVIETFMKTWVKTKKDMFFKKAEALTDEYESIKNKKDSRTNSSVFSFQRELDLCRKYVNLRLRYKDSDVKIGIDY